MKLYKIEELSTLLYECGNWSALDSVTGEQTSDMKLLDVGCRTNVIRL
jgi:hypothetical protein